MSEPYPCPVKICGNRVTKLILCDECMEMVPTIPREGDTTGLKQRLFHEFRTSRKEERREDREPYYKALRQAVKYCTKRREGWKEKQEAAAAAGSGGGEASGS